MGMVLVYVLVWKMLLVANVTNVLLDIGAFLHVKTVPVIRMGLLTPLAMSQVDNVVVLIMFLGINAILVQLDGMVSQAVKNVFVTLLVLWMPAVLMMVECVQVIQELNVMPVLMDGL